MKKIFAVANGVAFVSTIVMNYLSNTKVFNGNDNKSVSDEYFNYFTPAGYAFSIWGLIYLGLLGFVFYTGRVLYMKNADDKLLSKIGWWFVISCIANSLWLVAWLYELPGIAAIIMSVIFLSLVKIILNIRAGIEKFSVKDYLFVALPFTLYLGWISVAFIANIAALLTKIGWGGWGIDQITWTIIIISVAGLINLFMILKRNLPEYGAVGIWALMAISVSNSDDRGGLNIIITCYIVSAILLVAIVVNAFRKRKVMD